VVRIVQAKFSGKRMSFVWELADGGGPRDETFTKRLLSAICGNLSPEIRRHDKSLLLSSVGRSPFGPFDVLLRLIWLPHMKNRGRIWSVCWKIILNNLSSRTASKTTIYHRPRQVLS